MTVLRSRWPRCSLRRQGNGHVFLGVDGNTSYRLSRKRSNNRQIIICCISRQCKSFHCWKILSWQYTVKQESHCLEKSGWITILGCATLTLFISSHFRLPLILKSHADSHRKEIQDRWGTYFITEADNFDAILECQNYLQIESHIMIDTTNVSTTQFMTQ